MAIRRWKAFLRLQGESLVQQDEDILNEFKGFVQDLKQVGIDYSIVVNVEEGKPERLTSGEEASTTLGPHNERVLKG